MLKVVLGFPAYSASRDGSIWSSKSERFLRPNLGDRYPFVVLFKDGERHEKRVHRLVLETFAGPCPVGMECRHLNGDKQDNRLCNLKWGTRKENIHDAIRHGTHPCLRHGEASPRAKLKEKDVRMIIYMYNTGLFKHRELAKVYKVHMGTIGQILTKRIWRHAWKDDYTFPI